MTSPLKSTNGDNAKALETTKNGLASQNLENKAMTKKNINIEKVLIFLKYNQHFFRS